MELLLARNPDPDSRLPYLLWLPLGEGGLVFRTGGTWPRTKAIYCYPVPVTDWPAEPELVEQVPIRSCVRRGSTIDLVLDRARENRSQLVYTTARGRQAVFWQAPRTRKQSRPNVARPSARASGIAELAIVIDSHERYAYRFTDKPVTVTRRGLPCGDYAVLDEHQQVLAAVERKSLPDLVSALTSGKLGYALAELAGLPRAAVVVEDRYSEIFKLDWVRPAVVADGLAETQVRWPTVSIMFAQTRPLAEEWTYRYLAAATTWTHPDQPDQMLEARYGAVPAVPSSRRRQPGRWAIRWHRPRLGPPNRTRRPHPRPTPPPHLGRLAHRPQPAVRACWPKEHAGGYQLARRS